MLRVESEPLGATIYVDRRDLGSRGSAPRSLGLPAGRYKILVELPGYEPAEAEAMAVALGETKVVKLTLKQILGGVRIDGAADGASVRLDRDDGPVLGTAPLTINVPPGRHTLYVSRDGFQPSDLPVDVVANTTISVHPKMVPQTGAVVVNSDVREALVAVDGKPFGFTPTVLTLPVGPHRVQISQSGFKPFEQNVVIQATSQQRIDAQLFTLEEVTAASRVSETVEDAPSSVSIIPSQELRGMGYATVAEAVRGVRGMYLTDDRSYQTVGFRGFSRPGDYGNRVLVLIDGHPTNDSYIASSYVGMDARVDIDDVERIEIVRGPGSVLYGSSAFFGVINLVTRGRNTPTKGEVGLSALEYGTGRARVMANVNLGPDAGFWTSVSGAHSAGRDFFFPEFASDPVTGGNARGVDGFDAGTLAGRAWYKSFTVQWLLTSRKKNLPTGEYGSVFGSPSNRFSDTRSFIEARFEPQVSKDFQILSRAHANLYNFDGLTTYLPVDGGPATESFKGKWAGLEQRIVWTPSSTTRITLGGEAQRHFETQQLGSNDQAAYILDSQGKVGRNDPFTVAAGYANADITPVRLLKVSAGARFDSYSNSGSALSPRLAVILRPYEGGNIKFLAGRAFRAPSVYELFYRGQTQVRPDETGITLCRRWPHSAEF